jgi:hypothetical protein
MSKGEIETKDNLIKDFSKKKTKNKNSINNLINP